MSDDTTAHAHGTRQADEISDWLRAHLAILLKCSREDIDPTAPIDRLGLDSATAVGVTLDLEDWLGRSIEPAIFYDYATVQDLAAALASGAGTSDDQNPPIA